MIGFDIADYPRFVFSQKLFHNKYVILAFTFTLFRQEVHLFITKTNNNFFKPYKFFSSGHQNAKYSLWVIKTFFPRCLILFPPVCYKQIINIHTWVERAFSNYLIYIYFLRYIIDASCSRGSDGNLIFGNKLLRSKL